MVFQPEHRFDLTNLIRRTQWLMDLLSFLEAHGPTQASVGAGAIAAQVWNDSHRNDDRHGIKDIDVVYFDPDDPIKSSEEELEETLASAFAPLGLPFDVKNQARVHLWYREKFGYEIPPYPDLKSAVATWPTTATAVAVNTSQGDLNIIAPFGLDDLLGGTVRPNKTQITEDIYERKVARWRDVWPDLQFLSWD